MATSILPNDISYTNIDNKRLEIFCLIWLDSNVNMNEARDTDQKLRSIINDFKKFQDIKQCQQYIEQSSQKDRLILIVNGRLGRELVPSIYKLQQVISIYVYCMDKKGNEQWASKFSKVKAVVTEFDELIYGIKEDYQIQKGVEEPLPINICTTSVGPGRSTGGVNGEFVFFQILIDCLLRLKSTQIDRTELINYCKTQYEGNINELRNIDEFQNDYLPNKALWWYTREMFFYKILNAALRRQDIHMIFLFRQYISDIYQQLQEYQSKNSLKVYRGQKMSINELKNLKESMNQFISINSFFSTSTEYKKALAFLKRSTPTEDSERVFFEIDADPNMVTTKPFANISQVSAIPSESEVLFMIGSIFHLKSIHCNDDQIWTIRMTLCSDDEHELKEVLLHMKQQIGSEETNLRTLGKLLWQMGKFDLAEKYFNRLLKELQPNDHLRINLYEDLGNIASQKGDFDMSVQWRKKLLEFKNKYPSTVKSNNSIDKINIRYNEETFKSIKNKIPELLSLNNKDNNENKNKILNDLLENGWQSLIKYKENINQKIYNEQINNNNSELIKLLKTYFELKWETEYSLSNQWFYLFLKEYKDKKNPQWYEHILTRTAQYGNKFLKNFPILSIVLQLLFDGIDDKCLKETNIFNDLWLSITHDGLKSIEKYSDYINPEIMDEQINKNQSVLFQTLYEYNRQDLFQLLKQNNIPNTQNLYDLALNNVVQYGWVNGIKLMQGKITPIKFKPLLENIDLFLKQQQVLLHAALINIPANATWNKNGQTVAGGQYPTLSSPQDVYVDDEQTIYVADYGNNRIVAWKLGEINGQIVAGGHGQGNGIHQLNGPTDVIVDKERDSLIICDRLNRRVVRWSRQNRTSGEIILSNIFCRGLTMDDNGFLYATDIDKDEVRRYRIGESQGIVVAGGNGAGNRLDQLNYPRCICVDHEYSVFVSDNYNHRVMKWIKGAKEGIVVAGGQGQGSSLTQLSSPDGIVVDQLGTVYVADNGNQRIVRWPKGAQQGHVIVGGNGEGAQSSQFNCPIRLSFDRQGNLYVADHNNNRIQRFNIEIP